MSDLGPLAARALALPIGSPGKRAVLRFLAAFIESGRPDVSTADLAARADLEPGNVAALLTALEGEGWLEVERWPGSRPVYRLLDENGEAL